MIIMVYALYGHKQTNTYLKSWTLYFILLIWKDFNWKHISYMYFSYNKNYKV